MTYVCGVVVLLSLLTIIFYIFNKMKWNRLLLKRQEEIGEVNVRICNKNTLVVKTISTSFITLILFLIIFLFPGSNRPNNTVESESAIFGHLDSSLFSMIQVSANEYVINNYGDGVIFEVYTLIDNPDIIIFNEEYSYYKNMEKYLDVTDQTEVKSILIGNFKILEVTIDNRIKVYLELVDKKGVEVLNLLDFDFDDFESDMLLLSNLLEEYPPISYEKERWDSTTVIQYEINNIIENVEDVKKVELYKWYVPLMNNVAGYSSNSDLVRLEHQIYMDGVTIDNIGEIAHQSNAVYFGDKELIDGFSVKTSNTPLLLNDCNDTFSSSAGGGDEDLGLRYKYYVQKPDLCAEYNDMVFVSSIVDFSNFKLYDISELDIVITINGIVMNKDEFLFVDDYVYVFPIKIHSYRDDVQVIFDIEIFKDDKELYTGSTSSTERLR
ncbi:hypothetical protein RI065_08370 [Mycoplasmatota bacterium zrk1]